jgi:hypothetical protein
MHAIIAVRADDQACVAAPQTRVSRSRDSHLARRECRSSPGAQRVPAALSAGPMGRCHFPAGRAFRERRRRRRDACARTRAGLERARDAVQVRLLHTGRSSVVPARNVTARSQMTQSGDVAVDARNRPPRELLRRQPAGMPLFPDCEPGVSPARGDSAANVPRGRLRHLDCASSGASVGLPAGRGRSLAGPDKCVLAASR